MNQQDSADFYREMDALAARDWQLWSIAALIIVMFAIGFVSMILPNVTTASLHGDSKYLPQLFFGLIVLIILFNIYLLDQKRELNRVRAQMLRQMAESARAQELAIVDPLTTVFNRRYMEEVIAKEQARADRSHSELSFLIIDCDDFKAINTKFGHFGGDQYLKDFARLLKSTFRGSDTILRIGGDEFMVILPETGNSQARRAAERLLWEVNWRNQASEAGYQLAFSYGVATYTPGQKIDEILKQADESLYQAKQTSRSRSSQSAHDMVSSDQKPGPTPLRPRVVYSAQRQPAPKG